MTADVAGKTARSTGLVAARLLVRTGLLACQRRGQATLEFALVFAAVLLPATLALILTSELLWIWHSVNDFTRQGAGYAATHCWQESASNVRDFMRANVPLMPSREQFQNGSVEIVISYYSRDSESGQMVPFQCSGDCTTGCIPETVTVTVKAFEFRGLTTSLGLPPVALPDFQTSLPMESAGCDQQGVCLP